MKDRVSAEQPTGEKRQFYETAIICRKPSLQNELCKCLQRHRAEVCLVRTSPADCRPCGWNMEARPCHRIPRWQDHLERPRYDTLDACVGAKRKCKSSAPTAIPHGHRFDRRPMWRCTAKSQN